MDAHGDIEVVEVAYGRTINTGNFENVRIELRAKVKPGQSYRYVWNAIREMAKAKEKEIRAEQATDRACA